MQSRVQTNSLLPTISLPANENRMHPKTATASRLSTYVSATTAVNIMQKTSPYKSSRGKIVCVCFYKGNKVAYQSSSGSKAVFPTGGLGFIDGVTSCAVRGWQMALHQDFNQDYSVFPLLNHNSTIAPQQSITVWQSHQVAHYHITSTKCWGSICFFGTRLDTR